LFLNILLAWCNSQQLTQQQQQQQQQIKITQQLFFCSSKVLDYYLVGARFGPQPDTAILPYVYRGVAQSVLIVTE
jgi:hypothetical protein